MKSVVYLCCPVQSREGWAYLTAIATILKGNWDGNEARRLLPARQLDFQTQEMNSIFEETHNLGNWVVNYDELLDRRQVENQDARVIRYKQSATQGRNIIISSKTNLNFLENLLVHRLKALHLDLDEVDYQHLAKELCDDANRISGDIVLRAARRGRNASELIGVVLSRFLIQHELSNNDHFGWYFLDDYAEWLGLKEGRIADILALSPSQGQDEKLRLDIVVSEAKYIKASNLSGKKKESQKHFRTLSKELMTQSLINQSVLTGRFCWQGYPIWFLMASNCPRVRISIFSIGDALFGKAHVKFSCVDIPMYSFQILLMIWSVRN